MPVTTRSKLVAILLALFLGLFGVHRFYLGRWRSGCLYLLFSWTGLPGVFALMEIIYLLCLTEEGFARRYPTSYIGTVTNATGTARGPDIPA